MNYWLDLFTGATWSQFREAGANVSGFRSRKAKTAAKIQRGDILLCYLTGVMRWVGALEVIGPSADKRRIWKADFPVRLDVKPLVMLDPDSGIPMSEFEGHLCFYDGPKDRGKFKGFLRGSPNLFRNTTDGERILSAVKQAQQNPVIRPVDPKKLFREPLFKVERQKGTTRDATLVTIPAPEEGEGAASAKPSDSSTTRHTEIQYELLRLGADLGLDVWVAKERSRTQMERQHAWRDVKYGGCPPDTIQ